MTLYNAFQLALASVALALIARQTRRLLFQAPIADPATLDDLVSALATRDLGTARRTGEACAPAWAARLALCAIAELERDQAAQPVIDELRADFARAASFGQGALTTFGRIANSVALIGVIVELGKAFAGGEGLLALQRGLPVRVALQRSLVTFAIGLATSALCFSALAMLRRRARVVGGQLERVASVIERPRNTGVEM